VTLCTCLQNGGTPEECLCQVYGIGCGGGGDPDPTPDDSTVSSFEFENIFAEKHSGSTGSNEDWTLKRGITLNGVKFSNNFSLNYYTSFTAQPNCIYNNNNPSGGGLYGYTLSFAYCYLIGGGGVGCSSTSELINNDKTFKNTSSTIVYYPNHHNQQGQITPYSVPYSNTKFAYAFSDL
jgi:hypothetical protein